MITNRLFLLSVAGAPAPAPALLDANLPREMNCIARNTADGKDRAGTCDPRVVVL